MPEPSIRLLFVGNFLDIAIGTRAISEDLSLQLRARGWEVMITSRQKHKARRLLDMLQAVWTKRNKFDVAIVDVYSGPAFFWAEAVCLLLRRIRRPYILTMHGGNLPLFAAQSNGRVRKLLNSAAIVTAPSRYLQEMMQPHCCNLRVVPNPISLDHYAYRWRREAQPHIVWLRAFHEVYNPQLAVAAVTLLQDEFPGVTLKMIGPDKQDGTLAGVQAEVARRGLSSKVEFVGPVPKSETGRYLRNGDIFVNTANIDNTPVTILEAMACGLCVVSTKVGGIPYLIEDGLDGMLVPPRDPVALADAIRRILRDPPFAQRLSANARRKVEAFDWAVVIPEWQNLLQIAASGGSVKPDRKLAVETRP